MKIEVESEALDTLKAMAQRLQDERDELFAELVTLRGACAAAGWLKDPNHIKHMDDSRSIIAKCTSSPKVME